MIRRQSADGVEDLRLAVASQCFSKRLDTEVRVSVLDKRQARISRVVQSMIATKYTKPRAIGKNSVSLAQTWLG